MVFDSDAVLFKDKPTGDVLLQAPSVGNVYPVSLPAESPVVSANLAFSSSGDHWHRCLGHCKAHVITLLKKQKLLNFSSSFLDNCSTYCLAESHRLPFTLVEHCTRFPLELIYSDV